MKDKKLTTKQKQLLDFIKGFILVFERSPTLKECSEGLERKNLTQISNGIKKLEEMGYIKCRKKRYREIRIVNQKQDNNKKQVAIEIENERYEIDGYRHELRCRGDRWAVYDVSDGLNCCVADTVFDGLFRLFVDGRQVI